MLPLHGIAFFGFNALRSLSIIATELVLATTVFVMVLDGREYNAAHKTPSEDYTDCEYYPGTDVPTHVWGIFWVQLDRTFILILLILCTLSGESGQWAVWTESPRLISFDRLARFSVDGPQKSTGAASYRSHSSTVCRFSDVDSAQAVLALYR